MKPITVLICDDSALIRRLFTEMLSEEPDIQVVGTAVDPIDARAKIKELNPQVLTLDIEMPNMDGISFLEKIMSLRPMPVVMASTLTQKGADATIRALEIGAVDYVSKPTGSQTGNAIRTLKQDLVAKVRAAAQTNLTRRSRTTSAAAPSALSFSPRAANGQQLIAIGSSTGGVEALRDIFQMLPGNLPPIVMVQHMPEQFTASLAARLNNVSQVTVAEAKDGAPLQDGHAYLAPGGGNHLRVVKRGKGWACQVKPGEPVSGHRPSVDVLFESVAEAVKERAVGIILTGMGKDGAAGMVKMREAGAYNIGQSANSCVVYGMPKAAAAAGAVHKEAPLSDIAAHLISALEEKREVKHAS